jgi:hypothetical protein
MDRPKQVDDLEIVEVADGFVVYQADRDRVHYFNHTAALVLTFADGSKSTEEITSLIQRCYDLPQAPTAEVGDCLVQLRKEGLVR